MDDSLFLFATSFSFHVKLLCTGYMSHNGLGYAV